MCVCVCESEIRFRYEGWKCSHSSDGSAISGDDCKTEREKAAKREAANRESEAKLERSRKGRSLGTSFARQRGGSAADRRGTAVSAMGSMWTRGVSTCADLEQGLPYVSRGTVPRFPVECFPSEYIAGSNVLRPL